MSARRRAGRGHGAATRVRGATLIEVMATMVILMVGLAAAGGAVVHTVQQNRRSLTQGQAQTLAERELEAVMALGCRAPPSDTSNDPCRALKALDGTSRTLTWTATGVPGAGGAGARAYTVEVDVDPPFEGAERGVPAVTRGLAGDARTGRVVNVRVTVLWDEPGRGRQAVALQTRVSPDTRLAEGG